jgi:large subunit ribosomal protein L3
MGARTRTQQNLEIVRTDAERGLIFVKGSVPGSKGAWLVIKDAVKVPAHAERPYPVAPKSAMGAAPAAEPVIEADVTVADDATENTEA